MALPALASGTLRSKAARSFHRRPARGGAESPAAKGPRVTAVHPGSPGEASGIRAGDAILEIDGSPIRDFLDFYLASFGPEHTVTVSRGRSRRRLKILRAKAEDAGVEIALEGLRPCNNKCTFCFIDQLPPGLRDDLYFKDEDYRLSFLHGSYLTLTNLGPRAEERIVRAHLSPLYVSVHSTDEKVRARLLGRTPREPILETLDRLGGQGIKFHAQIVVVPGVNSGADLTATLVEMSRRHRSVLSVSVVPVGLTFHRQHLPQVRPVDEALARTIVSHVADLNRRLHRRLGRGMIYASDELHILAGSEIPASDYYDDFPQIENGVGLVRQLLDESSRVRVPAALRGKHVRFVTGRLAQPYIDRLAARLSRGGLTVDVVQVENDLLGPAVTVSGLLPGRAISRALSATAPCDAAVLPPDVANVDGLTLDGVKVSGIESRAGMKVLVACQNLNDTLRQLASLLGRN